MRLEFGQSFFLSDRLVSVVVWFAGGEQSHLVGQGAYKTLRLAMSRAFFLRHLIVLKHSTVGQTERRPITMVLLIAGQEVVSFGSGSLFGFGFGQDFTHLAFVLNFNL